MPRGVCGGSSLAQDGDADALERGKGRQETGIHIHSGPVDSHQVCSLMWAENLLDPATRERTCRTNDARAGGECGRRLEEEEDGAPH